MNNENLDFLKNLTFQKSKWRDEDSHTHCQICERIITNNPDHPNSAKEGYISVEDDYGFWICNECFKQKKDEYNWKIKITSDWRLTNQENYLKNKELTFQRWEKLKGSTSDHDHCAFCFAKFTDRDDIKDSLQEGYCTKDRYHWICEKCFGDFKDRFNWQINNEPN